jgi:putative endonuclease
MHKQYYIYILASKRNGTLYIGATDDLIKRTFQHKNGLVDGFTKKYNVHLLVYFESTTDLNSMTLREQQMKKWKRQWKINVIEKENPEWNDLYKNII